jgi:hypothetical protein
MRKWITIRREVIEQDRIPRHGEYGKPVYAFNKLEAIVQNVLINGDDYIVVGEAIDTFDPHTIYIECDRYGPIPMMN